MSIVAQFEYTKKCILRIYNIRVERVVDDCTANMILYF